MTQALNILMLGGGNMAQAILAGLKRSGLAAAIQLVEPAEALHKTLTQTGGLASNALFTSLEDLLRKTPLLQFNWLVLAVKPQQAQEALLPVLSRMTQSGSMGMGMGVGMLKSTGMGDTMGMGTGNAPSSPALLSIAAGLSVQKLHDWSGLQAIVRCMPNTPAMVGQGITGLYAPTGLQTLHREQSNDLMRGLGPTVWLDTEDAINTVTAISGSGPAYVFYFVECFIKAAQATGLSPDTARMLAWQTVKGSVALLDSSEETVESLRAKVTSKGGTTAAAMEKLGEAGLEQTLACAIDAAQKRARELS
ncbi:MAG: pyrroline-5-carboxylate reductase [Proteobacteria bacterium]|nr:pyrroline-5-carboxylate reductase [Pseudomonadota bacterium]